jgi:hypothetical protein
MMSSRRRISADALLAPAATLRDSEARVVSTRVVETGFACVPPISKAEWHGIQQVHVRAGTLVHSDGAAAYQSLDAGVLQDWVSHGSNTRKNAVYAKKVTHKRPSGNYVAVAGTQSVALSICFVDRLCVSVNQIGAGAAASLRSMLE